MTKIYAGFWIRFFAGILDLALLAPFAITLFYLGKNPQMAGAAHFMSYTISIAYVAYFLSGKKQATFGKRLMGIYVARSDGSKLTTSRAISRAASSILTSLTLGLGFIVVVFNKEKISLHDFLCDTRVFYGKRNG
jgi:uncharacterized RDD family membrane protein YckC